MTVSRVPRRVVGIDSSTQSCKAVWLDADTGEVAEVRSAPHPDGTAVDVAHWWDALQSLGVEERPVAGLSVAAQQHGMIALDADGVPVHDALLWNDTRSAPQAEQLLQEFGLDYWTYEIGTAPVASLTVTKVAWLAQAHPELAARVQRIVLPHDWLTSRLRSERGDPTTDRSDASGTGYFAVADGAYRLELLEYSLGHVPELPRVAAPWEVVGATPAGTPIAAGAGDNAAAALGLGIEEGDVVVSLGTSGTVFTSTRARVIDGQGAIAGFADAAGGYLPIMVTLNAARVLDATRTLLGTDTTAFDRLAASAAPDAAGLTLLPYLDGERSPNLPTATGALHGLRRTNLTPENLARASVLGVLFGLSESLTRMRTHGVPVRTVTLIGGASRSPAVQQAAADVFGVPVRVPRPAEYVAIGAAKQALAALDGPDALRPVVPERVVEPTREGWVGEAYAAYARAREQVYPGAWGD